MNIAECVAIDGKKTVAIFSLEMNKDELIERSLASLGRIESDLMRSGKLSNNDFLKISDLLQKYNGAKLFIEDYSSLSVPDIRSRCRKIKREHGLDLVVVDYIGLIAGEGENETDRIGKISRALKLLARDLNVPIIAVSQLNRGVEQRQDKRPTMSDLRQSGAVEQDADLILFIYRDEIYNKQSANKGIAEIIIAKNRHGGLGTIYLTFEGRYCRFDNYLGFPILQTEKSTKQNHFYDRSVNHG
jgi:replicative DNA helicase